MRRDLTSTTPPGGALLTAVAAALLLAACGPTQHTGSADRTPARIADAPARLPVPQGKGSRTPDDFNGDGHRDLVLGDLVKARAHEDDPGIGIVYGSARGLVPGTRQLITPRGQGAATDGQLPALFDAEATCDLDKDGFSDLVVSTDPPYDGQGRPPVPIQLLFGSPKGLTGKAVHLTVPPAARVGDDWPDQPVCGDFDGDGAKDLVLHATGGHLTYLRGPFTREGAPREAGAPIVSPGEVPTGPAADVDRDGYDDLVVRTAQGTGPSAVVLGGPAGPTRTGAVLPSGIDVALGAFGRGKALDAAVGGGGPPARADSSAGEGGTSLRYDLPTAVHGSLDAAGSVLDAADFDGDGRSELVSSGSRLRIFQGRTAGPSPKATVTVEPPATGTTRVVAVGDFDGDGRADLAVRTYRSETKDVVAVFSGAEKGLVTAEPSVTFSTSGFLTDS
ncbi:MULTISPECIES: VCBS repeat-containing protein [Streptomyces]|uniref:FG-GAP repeat domain-containing protein n=1 Tax=Streptomyces sp. 12257 TaxID=3041009 RepID=UPI00142897F2|nr:MULTISPECIES: VCBS repeat-containing protein [Streptomyces]MDI5912016.1 VCBS repeat-containing protein [Streptomyces sp. 12257]